SLVGRVHRGPHVLANRQVPGRDVGVRGNSHGVTGAVHDKLTPSLTAPTRGRGGPWHFVVEPRRAHPSGVKLTRPSAVGCPGFAPGMALLPRVRPAQPGGWAAGDCRPRRSRRPRTREGRT